MKYETIDFEQVKDIMEGRVNRGRPRAGKTRRRLGAAAAVADGRSKGSDTVAPIGGPASANTSQFANVRQD